MAIRIKHLCTPRFGDEAANKEYVDSKTGIGGNCKPVITRLHVGNVIAIQGVQIIEDNRFDNRLVEHCNGVDIVLYLNFLKDFSIAPDGKLLDIVLPTNKPLSALDGSLESYNCNIMYSSNPDGVLSVYTLFPLNNTYDRIYKLSIRGYYGN